MFDIILNQLFYVADKNWMEFTRVLLSLVINNSAFFNVCLLNDPNFILSHLPTALLQFT